MPRHSTNPLLGYAQFVSNLPPFLADEPDWTFEHITEGTRRSTPLRRERIADARGRQGPDRRWRRHRSLTAATALRCQGIAVDLVEKNPDHSVYGIGIMQPNNILSALDRIGLADRCVAEDIPFDGWRIYDSEGAFLMEALNGSNVSPRHPPANGTTRPMLQRILLGAARDAGARLQVGVMMDMMADTGDGVIVTLTNGARDSYDPVIGCDGLNLPMRRRPFPDAGAPTFTGQAV